MPHRFRLVLSDRLFGVLVVVILLAALTTLALSSPNLSRASTPSPSPNLERRFSDGVADTASSVSTPPGPDTAAEAKVVPGVPACVPPFRNLSGPIPTGDDDRLHSVAVRATDDAWAVGSKSSYMLQTLVEHWDGISWSVVDSPNVGPASNWLRGVAAVATNDVWAVGTYADNVTYDKRTLIQRWNGTQWSVVSSPNPKGDNYLMDITSLASNDMWAVGYNSYFSDERPLMLHWDGSQWSAYDNPVVDSTGSGVLYSVSGSASNDVWAVGATEPSNLMDPLGPTAAEGALGPVVLQWNGTHWRQHDLAAFGSATLTGVHARAANDVWAVGYTGYPNRTFILHWNGSKWSRVPSPNVGAPSNFLHSVTASAPNSAWAVGFFSSDASQEAGPLVLRWDGAQWSVNPTEAGQHRGAYLYAVSALKTDPTYMWAVGSYTRWDYVDAPYVMYYNGSCATPTPLPTSTPTNTATATATPTCGPRFTQSSVANRDAQTNQLKAVAVVAPNDVWAVGYYFNGSREETLIQHWNGGEWSVVPSPNRGEGLNRLEAVAAISTNDVWAVGHYVEEAEDGQVGQEQLTRTLAMHWDGTRWSVVATPNDNSFDNFLKGVAGVAANDVWAVGYAGPRGSYTHSVTLHWDGNSWTRVASPNPLTFRRNLLAVTAIAANDVWAVGYVDDAGYSGLTMHWDGAQWTHVASGLYSDLAALTGVSGVSANDVWAVGYTLRGTSSSDPLDTVVLRWNGQQWSRVASPNPSTYNRLAAVKAVSLDEAWAVGMTYTSDHREITGFAQRWNGTRWYYVPADVAGSPGNMLEGVGATTAAEPGGVWAVGSQRNSSNVQRAHVQYLINPCPTPVSSHSGPFQDIPPGSTFQPFISCLAARNIVSGYGCGHLPEEPCDAFRKAYFRPGADVTRGQIAKMVALAANLGGPAGEQIFEDVPTTNVFYNSIQQLASRGYIGGYLCGAIQTEPCGAGNRPYFRPGAGTTRGQLSKIVAETARFTEDPGTQQFADVPSGSPFFVWINRLAARGVLGGYECGGAGEPCLQGHHPYFHPSTNVTRGQVSKVVTNSFFPGCQTQ